MLIPHILFAQNSLWQNNAQNPFPLQTEHHDHVERLFETYFHTIDEIQNEVQQLAANIKCV